MSVIISDKLQSNEVILKLRSAINLFIIDHGWIRAIINNNFYSINEGVYRSGQPSPKLFEQYIIKHNIKSIINLRYSDTSDQDIYLMQKNLCHKHNINMISIPISARRLPEKNKLKLILDTIKKIQKPFLVHCKTGADRTGFFMALYTFYNTNDIELAKKQLSLKYLHIRYSSTGILDYFFNLIKNLELNNTELEDWIEKKYDPQLITSNYKLGK
ncbi:MAG: tyrosine-protein phosphatase [Hyphomicrobiales bacterium]